MSAHHYMSEDEAIIFSVFYDKIEIDEILSYFELVDTFLKQSGLPMVYWIGDTVAADVSYQTFLDAINATLIGTKGSGNDERVIPLIIMDEQLTDFFIGEFKNRYHWAEFPIFRSAYEAYTFIKFIRWLQNE